MSGVIAPHTAFTVERWQRSSRAGVTIAIVAFVVLGLAPWWADRQALRLLSECFSYIALATLWNLLAGYGGLVSVGQQAFVGIGGYSLFLLSLQTGLNPLFGVPLAALMALVLAVAVALLLFRLRGAYFTIGSWVVAEVLQQVFLQVDAVGGGSGISLPASIIRSVISGRHEREILVYAIFLAMMAGTLMSAVLLLRGRWGLALAAVRDNELAAAASGIDVRRTRLVVFLLASVGAAIIGSLIFLQKTTITPVSGFSMNNWTVDVIFMTVIGGIGCIEGPIVGAIIFFMLRQYLADLGGAYLIIFGTVAILVMLLTPRGIWGYVSDRFGWQFVPLVRRLHYTPSR